MRKQGPKQFSFLVHVLIPNPFSLACAPRPGPLCLPACLLSPLVFLFSEMKRGGRIHSSSVATAMPQRVFCATDVRT